MPRSGGGGYNARLSNSRWLHSLLIGMPQKLNGIARDCQRPSYARDRLRPLAGPYNHRTRPLTPEDAVRY